MQKANATRKQGVQVKSDLYALFAYIFKTYMQFNYTIHLTNCIICGIILHKKLVNACKKADLAGKYETW